MALRLAAGFCLTRHHWLLLIVVLSTVLVRHGVVYCNLSCAERRIGATPHNFTLLVNATVTDNAITLTCTIAGRPSVFMSLSSDKTTLRWTENHKALPGPHYTVDTSTKDSVTVTIYNHTNVDYGVYTCQCYNDFSQEDIEEIYHEGGEIVFHRHCSEPVSVDVVPLSGEVEITRHIVWNKSEMVSVNCNTSDSDLLYTIHAPDAIGHVGGPSLEVEVIYASDQRKYICTNEQNRLTEVHYISIKDYQPPEFLYPPPENDITYFIPPTASEIPTCAVYSSLPRVSFIHEVSSQFFLDNQGNSKVENVPTDNNLHFATIPKAYASFFVFQSCTFKTKWEEVHLIYELFPLPGAETTIIPSICLYMSINPPSDSIKYGGSFTISCSIYSNIDIAGSQIRLLHVSNNDTRSQPLSSTNNDHKYHDTTHYNYFFHNVTEVNAGEYVCNFTVNEISRVESLSVPYLTKPTATTHIPPSSSIHQSSVIYSSSLRTTQYISVSTHSSSLLPSISHNATPTFPLSPSIAQIGHSPSPSSSSDNVQPLMYGVLIGCSILTIMILVAILTTCLLVYYYHKHQQKSKVAQAAMNRGPEHQLTDTTAAAFTPRGGEVDPEFDRVSVWSFSSLSENSVHHQEKKISENMRKCVHQLIVSNWYIPCDKILLCEGLGSGAFGKVKRAEIFGINKSNSISSVAVKMLKDDASEEAEKGIITEFNVLQNVGLHKHLVSLLGASLHNGKLSLVVEFCSGGDLLKYLRKKGNEKMAADQLTLSQQMDMGRQIACGMEYLASRKCVHRDLAARNILISEDGTLKVSDFGLARETYHSMYQMTTKGKIPFKWMAPESIFYQVYTTKSDIWSFGVLLWEIMTFGFSPYPGKSIEEVIKDLQKEKLMEQPDNCPVEVFNLILMCWKFEASERTSFTILKHNLTNLKFEEKANPTNINRPNQSTSSMGTSSSVTDGGYISSSSPAPPQIMPPSSLIYYTSESTASQGKDNDYQYDDSPLGGSEDGYVQCKDPTSFNVANSHKRTLTLELLTSTTGTSTLRHPSTSDQGSDAVFTDDSSGYSPSLSHHEDSGTYSNGSGEVVITPQYSVVTSNGNIVSTGKEMRRQWQKTDGHTTVTSV